MTLAGRGNHDHSNSGDRPQRPGRGIRLQRVLADAGVASRRDCEAMIESGRVRVNGDTVRTLPVFVDPENDSIEVDGRPVPKPERRLYLLLNKPERVLTTVDDSSEFAGTGTARTTVLDLVDHPARARLFPVGRLDFATRGLVLLTNDGELANRLTHPRYGVPKVYEAVVRGSVNDEQLEELRKLIGKQERQDARRRSEPGSGPRPRSSAEVEIIPSAPGETTIRLTLRERTGYPLRKLIVSAGCPVKKLTRVALGPLELTGVREGQWRELTRSELMLLRRDPRRAPASPKPAAGGGAEYVRRRGARPGRPGGSGRSAGPSRPGGSTRSGGPNRPGGRTRPDGGARADGPRRPDGPRRADAADRTDRPRRPTRSGRPGGAGGSGGPGGPHRGRRGPNPRGGADG